MDTTPAQGRVAGFIIISWILIRWSMSVCEMPQCIGNQNKPGTAQQVPHGKHKLSLITAVSVGYSRGPLSFSFFFLLFRLSCRGPLWNDCTSWEAVSTSQKPQKKNIYIYAWRWRLLQRLHLLISKMLKWSHWWILEFLSLWFLYRWSLIYASYGCKWACKQELLFVVGELSSISLVTTLSLVTAYICEH